MRPMHPQSAAMVFQTWKPDYTRPECVGEIRCCDRTVVMRNGRIICEVCDTIVETGRGDHGELWQVVRTKGEDV